jgi:hypothetical protein
MQADKSSGEQERAERRIREILAELIKDKMSCAANDWGIDEQT